MFLSQFLKRFPTQDLVLDPHAEKIDRVELPKLLHYAKGVSAGTTHQPETALTLAPDN